MWSNLNMPRDGGKGDTPRPLSISIEQFDKNFDEIFGKKEEKKDSVQLELDVSNDEQVITITKTWEI
jgi:hypothetical protein